MNLGAVRDSSHVQASAIIFRMNLDRQNLFFMTSLPAHQFASGVMRVRPISKRQHLFHSLSSRFNSTEACTVLGLLRSYTYIRWPEFNFAFGCRQVWSPIRGVARLLKNYWAYRFQHLCLSSAWLLFFPLWCLECPDYRCQPWIRPHYIFIYNVLPIDRLKHSMVGSKSHLSFHKNMERNSLILS